MTSCFSSLRNTGRHLPDGKCEQWYVDELLQLCRIKAKLSAGVVVPVLIVGAGPAGATTALLLGRSGIRCMVISRHRSTANTPRAHIFNQRAMEVLRDANIEHRVHDVAVPAQYMMHTSWLHSLAGEEYGRMYAWGNRPDRKGEYELASPCAMSDLPQSELEPILVEEAERLGAVVKFATEFVSQEELPDGRISTTVKDRESGVDNRIVSDFLVGADGARSAVLDSLGIPIVGKQLNTAFNVHIKADLSKYFEVRPGSLNWILNPDAPEWSATGNFRMVRPWNEFVVSLHPATKDTREFDPTDQDVIKRLHQMIGDASIPIEILSTFRWTINDQVAVSYQKSNVTCIGDAVHRHPPINGLGSNTCVGDAMNLSWKLAYVLNGIADKSIIDTVTIERKPVGDGVVRRANAGMELHRQLWKVIGLSAEERRETTETMSQADSYGAALRRRFREALDAMDLEFHALGIQMNQIYTSSPLTVTDEDDKHGPDLSLLDLEKEQVISTYPGFHLPHVWIAKNGQTHRVSTLDLCGHGAFTLLTGIGGDLWKAWASDLERKRPGLRVYVYTIGWRQDYMDAYGDWAKIRGVDENGAVLVRPDHFVAWRSKRLPREGGKRLVEVLERILPPKRAQ